MGIYISLSLSMLIIFQTSSKQIEVEEIIQQTSCRLNSWTSVFHDIFFKKKTLDIHWLPPAEVRYDWTSPPKKNTEKKKHRSPQEVWHWTTSRERILRHFFWLVLSSAWNSSSESRRSWIWTSRTHKAYRAGWKWSGGSQYVLFLKKGDGHPTLIVNPYHGYIYTASLVTITLHMKVMGV